jgi:hypothetical protein
MCQRSFLHWYSRRANRLQAMKASRKQIHPKGVVKTRLTAEHGYLLHAEPILTRATLVVELKGGRDTTGHGSVRRCNLACTYIANLGKGILE